MINNNIYVYLNKCKKQQKNKWIILKKKERKSTTFPEANKIKMKRKKEMVKYYSKYKQIFLYR